MYNIAADGPIVVRDQATIRAAEDAVYVNTRTTVGQRAGSFALTLLGASPSERVVGVYQSDALIASVNCTNTACGSFPDTPDINHAGLADHAHPYQVINDRFDDHQTYLETILAISEDPSYMLLDRRPRADFPVVAQTPTLVISLPTVVAPMRAAFDQDGHIAQVRAVNTSVQPEGATLDWVRITDMDGGVIADKDNNQPVTAGSAPIPFPDAQFFTVPAKINGITTLTQDAYDTLSSAALRDFDVDALFAGFVTSRLQTSCLDYFLLKVDGPFERDARPYEAQDEVYFLDYYDLREAP